MNHIKNKNFRFIDLFCGIGGFRFAIESAAIELHTTAQCVFSSDIDEDAQMAYEANFCEKPTGDITKVNEVEIPDHDILLAGFPCQAFSIIGDRKGFEDARGTLFFDIARILKEKKPKAFVLENVKQLRGHDKGRTLRRIMETLHDLGYFANYKILNALDYGLPQRRERIFIVGFLEPIEFCWPKKHHSYKPLSEILEQNVDSKYYASEKIKERRLKSREGKEKLLEHTIWHENKSGHVSAYPYSCALRAGASYNYLLVDGKRRLTEREMLRLQGFPESFKIVCNYSATRKQAGNSVAVPCVKEVVLNVLKSLVDKKANQGSFDLYDQIKMNFTGEGIGQCQ